MFDFLDKLRKKPAHTRQSIALGVSVGITLIIFIMWLFGLIWNLNHPPADEGQGPIESMVSGISNQVQSVQNEIATSTIGQY